LDRDRLDVLDRTGGVDTGSDCGGEWSESRPDSGPDSPECLFEKPPGLHHHLGGGPHHPHHPHHHPHHQKPSSSPTVASSVDSSLSTATSTTSAKPRIWSLADMASKESEVSAGGIPSAFYSTSGAGKLVSPLAARSGVHHHHPGTVAANPYARPHDFYRSIYGGVAAAAAAGGSLAAPGHLGGDVSLLETYSRTFGLNGGLGSIASTNNPGTGSGTSSAGSAITPLTSVLSKAAAAATSSAFSFNGGLGLTPLSSLTAASGASSASSSSSSSIEQQLATAGLHTAVTKLSSAGSSPGAENNSNNKPQHEQSKA